VCNRVLIKIHIILLFHTHTRALALTMSSVVEPARAATAESSRTQQLYFVATLACKAPFKRDVDGVPKEELMHGMLNMAQQSNATCRVGGGEVLARHVHGVFVILSGPAEAVLHACTAAAGLLQANTRHNTFRGKDDKDHVPFLCTVDIVGAALDKSKLPDISQFELRLEDDEYEQLAFGSVCAHNSLLLKVARQSQLDTLAAVVDAVPESSNVHALAGLVGRQLVVLPSVYDHNAKDDDDNGFVGAPPRWAAVFHAGMHAWIRCKPQKGTPEWQNVSTAQNKARLDKRKWLNSTRSPKQVIRRVSVCTDTPPELHRVTSEAWISFVSIAHTVAARRYTFLDSMVARWQKYVPTVTGGCVVPNDNVKALRPWTRPEPPKRGKKRMRSDDIAQLFSLSKASTASKGARSASKSSAGRTARIPSSAVSIPPPRAYTVAASSSSAGAPTSSRAARQLSDLIRELGISPCPESEDAATLAPAATSPRTSVHTANTTSAPRSVYKRPISHKVMSAAGWDSDDSDDSDAQNDSPSVAQKEDSAAEPARSVESVSPKTQDAAERTNTVPSTPMAESAAKPTNSEPAASLSDAEPAASFVDAVRVNHAQSAAQASSSIKPGAPPGWDGVSANAVDGESAANDAVPAAVVPPGFVQVTRPVIRAMRDKVTDIVLAMMRGSTLGEAVHSTLASVPNSGVHMDAAWCIHMRDIEVWDDAFALLMRYINVTKWDGYQADPSQPWIELLMDGTLGHTAQSTVTHVSKVSGLEIQAVCFARQKRVVSQVLSVVQDVLMDGVVEQQHQSQ